MKPDAELGGVPGDVAAAIARELDRLDPSAPAAAGRGGGRRGIRSGACGDRIATSIRPTRSTRSIDLLAGDLVRPGDVPRRFRFRHPIVRQAVYASAPAGWTLGAHARVAATLSDRGAAATARAVHLERSAAPGDEAAIATLTEAGNDASGRAPAAAAHWYGAALRLVADTDAPCRLGLLVPRARALAACGRFEDSLTDLAEVLDLMPPENPALRGRVIASAAKVKQLLGRHGEAQRELEGALDALDDPTSQEASTLKLELAADCFFTGDQDGFEHWVSGALADARARDDESMTAAATGLHSAALYMRDDVAAARVELDAALALIDQLDVAALTAHLNAHTWTALGAICLERFDEATALLDRTIDAALAAGQGHLPTLMRTTQALAWINQGRLRDAAIQLDAAVEASILTRNPVFLAWARSLQCWATLIVGDLPGAVRLGELALAGAGDDPLSATAACYLAEARLAAGDPEAVREEIISRAGGAELPRIERGFRARGFELLARAELALGDLAEAERWTVEAERSAAGLEISGRSADALRARLRAALGEWRGDAGAGRCAKGGRNRGGSRARNRRGTRPHSRRTGRARERRRGGRPDGARAVHATTSPNSALAITPMPPRGNCGGWACASAAPSEAAVPRMAWTPSPLGSRRSRRSSRRDGATTRSPSPFFSACELSRAIWPERFASWTSRRGPSSQRL